MFITVTYPKEIINNTVKTETYNFPFSLNDALFYTADELTVRVNEHLTHLGLSPLHSRIDGTGIQLNYIVDGIAYLIAGPRFGKVLSVNGGAIAAETRIIDQLAEELEEETFGALSFARQKLSEEGPWAYERDVEGHLMIISSVTHERYSLKFPIENCQSLENHPKYCYFATQVEIQNVGLESLKTIARTMTPTAKLWNAIGNEYFKLQKPKDFAGEWSTHWNSESIQVKRESSKAVVRAVYEEVRNQFLFDNPFNTFQVSNLEAALVKIFDEIDSEHAYWDMMKNKVGSYSERPYYAVYGKHVLKDSITLSRQVVDIDSINDSQGVFDASTILATTKGVHKYYPTQKIVKDLTLGSHSIVIFDNDGTLLHSQLAEAHRIFVYLHEIVNGEVEIPSVDSILKIGYGQKVWEDGLCAELKKICPALSDEMLSHLERKIQSASSEDVHVQGMSHNMAPLPGSQALLTTLFSAGAYVGVATDNYADVVKNALNIQLGADVICYGKGEWEMAKAEVTHRKKLFLNNVFDLILPEKSRKPNPTKLFLQQFIGFVQSGLVTPDCAQRYIDDGDYRVNLQSEARARGHKTIYIGDSTSDLIASHSAGYDVFIAVTTTGKHGYRDFIVAAEELKAKTAGSVLEIVMVDGLEQLNNTVCAPAIEMEMFYSGKRAASAAEVVDFSNIARSGASASV